MLGVCALAMVVRRHSPLLFVLVAGVCLTAHLVLFTEFSIFFILTGLIAVETTQSRLEAPWRWVGLVLELVGAAVATTRAHGLIGDQVHAGAGRLILLTNAWLVVAVAAFVGAARRRSRDRYNQAFERATVLEAQQATERRLAVIETQQRIARDVHDLLGHSLTVIAMQAEGARAILVTDPAAADEALAVIGETSRRSVDEVHALVDMLRFDAGAADVDAAAAPGSGSAAGRDSVAGAAGVGGPAAAGRPTGGTGGGAAGTVDAGAEDGAGTGEATSGQHVELLREPLRQAQRAGLPVTLETEPIGQIPPAAEHVLHRVAQESLTNVVRHAPGAATTVSLRTEMGRVALVVKNAPAPGAPTGDAVPASRNDDRSCLAGAGEQADAAPAGPPHESATVSRPVVRPSASLKHRGFGIIGMRDRVADLGGSFTAGPTPEGGWRVRAELPTSPE
ncbi:histidine kinase [Actinomyces oris]|nr:histidine kinase [Actinomyces oris]